MNYDVRATEPPSMKVLIDEDDYVEIEEAKKDDRYDVIFVAPDDLFYVAKGKEGVTPAVPNIPDGAIPVARIRVIFGSGVVMMDQIKVPTGNTGQHPAIPNGFLLNPNDPFEGPLIHVVEVQRRKRADYATPDDMWANFTYNAQMLNLPGYGPLEDILSMVTRKVGRITNLRGRPPQNESVIDSWLDLFVYAGLGYAYALKQAAEAYNAEIGRAHV